MLPSDPHAAARRLLEHERADVRSRQTPQLKILATARAAAAQEQLRHAPVALDGSGGQAAITDQVRLELRQ
jgi:hypothetical protein